jgi:ankyrin repeat protein
LEQKIAEDPNFQDSEKNEEIHEAIIRGNLQEVLTIVDKYDMKDGKSLPKMKEALEVRNYEGKSSIMLSIEHERDDITKYIIDTYADIDLDKVDIKDGNTALHIACLKGNYDIAQYIFSRRPRLCLK